MGLASNMLSVSVFNSVGSKGASPTSKRVNAGGGLISPLSVALNDAAASPVPTTTLDVAMDIKPKVTKAKA